MLFFKGITKTIHIKILPSRLVYLKARAFQSQAHSPVFFLLTRKTWQAFIRISSMVCPLCRKFQLTEAEAFVTASLVLSDFHVKRRSYLYDVIHILSPFFLVGTISISKADKWIYHLSKLSDKHGLRNWFMLKYFELLINKSQKRKRKCSTIIVSS